MELNADVWGWGRRRENDWDGFPLAICFSQETDQRGPYQIGHTDAGTLCKRLNFAVLQRFKKYVDSRVHKRA
jgi:hypothetical protein